MTKEDIELISNYIQNKKDQEHKTNSKLIRLETIKYERVDWEFSSVEEQKVHELEILNDTLALIYDYISEKK